MNKEHIYKKIYELAQELATNKTTFKRVDLAFELETLGVKGDSFEVAALVWEAYQKYNKDHRIETAFLTNDESKYLVKEYELHQQLTTGNNQEFLDGLEELIQHVGKEFNTVYRLINGNDSVVGKQLSQISLMTLAGSAGVGSVQDQATLIFNQYAKMMHSYEDLRDSVREVIHQFVMLRDDVASMYREYALGLVDVFGDSIKVVAPTLFDYDKIQYLDTQGMLEVIETEYNKLATTSGLLMEEIGDSFKATLRRSTNAIGQSKGNKAMIALAVVDMVGHYMDAAQKTQVLKNELVNFKSKVNYDIALVNGDMKRLVVVHRLLDELYVPKAHIFYRYVREVMQSEYDELIASIYTTPTLQKLKTERDTLLEEYNYLGKRIGDAQQNITYYKDTIANNTAFIKEGQDEYKQARALKPSKPLLMILGIGKDSYNREMYEWQTTCAPVIKGFETAQLNLKLDTEELEHTNFEMKKDMVRYKELHALLRDSNKKIAKELQVSDTVKLKIAQNLETYVKLLRIAKDIVESKLDNHLTDTVKIQKTEEFTLPEDIKQRLGKFTTDLKADLMIDEDSAKQEMMFWNDDDTKELLGEHQEELDKYQKEDITAMMQAQNKAVGSAIDLAQAWLTLQVNKELSAQAKVSYTEQVALMQENFKTQMSSIDNKAAVLREVMRHINTAGSQEQVRAGLLMLAEVSGEKFTARDIDDLLSGNKTIEI